MDSKRSLFHYPTAESIWNEHRESTRGRDLDITGLSYALLDAQGPQQWPMPQGQTVGRARLYTDGIFATPSSRARFVPSHVQALAEPCEPRFPLALNTGRLRDQWHGMSRTGTLARLFGHVAEPRLHMHPQDMADRRLHAGDLTYVTSRRASIVVAVHPSPDQGRGHVFLPMHWGQEFLSGASSTGQPLAGVNALTTSAYCPDSKQPELKHCAVKVLKADLPWTLLGMAWIPDDRVGTVREELRSLMPQFAFASCTPFGRERTGLRVRAAAHDAPPPEVIDRIEQLLGLHVQDVLRYADKKRGQRRAVQLVPAANPAGASASAATTTTWQLNAFVLAGDTSAQAWISTLLLDELPAQSYGRMLLSPDAKAPMAVQPKSQQVCTCMNVSEAAITQQLRQCSGSEAERLGQLQTALRCGTQCGSCLPEVKRLVRASAQSTVWAG